MRSAFAWVVNAARRREPRLLVELRKHAELKDDDEESASEWSVHRIRVNGVIVRYVHDLHSVQLTIEGELPEKTRNALTQDLLEKLTQLENTECELIQLAG